jgi:hypothetical protein
MFCFQSIQHLSRLFLLNDLNAHIYIYAIIIDVWFAINVVYEMHGNFEYVN